MDTGLFESVSKRISIRVQMFVLFLFNVLACGLAW